MNESDVPKPVAADGSGEHEPGQRSGAGARSLWDHMARDVQRKAPSAGSAARPNAGAGETGARDAAERAKHTVLVVDDSESARYALARALRAKGFRTAEAAAAEEALKLAEFASAVVLDVHLPDMDGLEVCRLLRARPKTASLPIVHVSAVDLDERHRSAASEVGADDYFTAPVDGERLAERLDELLTDRRAGSTVDFRA